MKLQKEKQILIIKMFKIAILILMAAVSLALGVMKGLRSGFDFQWDSAKLLANRINPYEASVNVDSPYYISEYGTVEANQFPSLLWLLLPYTFLGARKAAVVWLLSNFVFLFGIIVLLRKTFWQNIKKIDFILLTGVFWRLELSGDRFIWGSIPCLPSFFSCWLYGFQAEKGELAQEWL